MVSRTIRSYTENQLTNRRVTLAKSRLIPSVTFGVFTGSFCLLLQCWCPAFGLGDFEADFGVVGGFLAGSAGAAGDE